jgi:formylglycine-generating enzyme
VKRALAAIGVLALSLLPLGERDVVRARRSEPTRAPVLGSRRACAGYGGMPPGFRVEPHAGMVWIDGGSFEPGSQHGYADERPTQPTPRVAVAGFWMDRTEVTNAQFAAFVADTHYVTRAERDGASAVFRPPTETEAELGSGPVSWWRREAGSGWRHPEGPRSDLRGRASQPVVHIAYEDALAYARWLGRSLPSEDQWEYAARARRDDAALHRAPQSAAGVALANFWQGLFPVQNDAADGFAAQAPVGCYPANPFGLYDTIGNVWEWTQDLYAPRADLHESAHAAGEAGASCDTGRVEKARVIKGGSYLCASNFCARYRVAARHPHEPSTPTAHIGFRTVLAR